MDYNGLLNLGTELGRQLMESGAEIYRVEDSIHRLMQAYGVPDAQVFAIPNCLIVGVTPPEGHPVTRICRIPAHGIDLDQLERCNGLCRALCQQRPLLEEARRQTAELAAARPRYSGRAILLGYFLVGAFFTPFFGGGLLDSLCGGLCGLSIGLATRMIDRIAGSNSFFRTMLSSLLAALLAQLFVRFGAASNADAITIGALMLLVPGVALTTAMREMVAGDIISGVAHLTESILTATAIALGTGAALMLGQLL